MKASYIDILEGMPAEALSWYDQHGCPRYRPFDPALCTDVYAQQVFLLRIACQRCGDEFDVEVCTPWILEAAERIVDPCCLHYGDPPRHDDQAGYRCAGDTMSCDDLEVLQAWEKNEDFKWVRMPEMEGRIE